LEDGLEPALEMGPASDPMWWSRSAGRKQILTDRAAGSSPL